MSDRGLVITLLIILAITLKPGHHILTSNILTNKKRSLYEEKQTSGVICQVGCVCSVRGGINTQLRTTMHNQKNITSVLFCAHTDLICLHIRWLHTCWCAADWLISDRVSVEVCALSVDESHLVIQWQVTERWDILGPLHQDQQLLLH